MKTHLLTAGVLALCGSCNLSAQETEPEPPPIPVGAQATVPLAELLRLVAAPEQTKTPDPPPVRAAVTDLSLRLAFGSETPQGTAEVQVAAFADGWHLVPLIGGPFALRSVEPADASMVVRDGMLCLLTRNPGKTRVKLGFEIPPIGEGNDSLRICVPPSTASRIEVASVPAGKRLVFAGEGVQAFGNAASAPSRGGSVEIRFVDDKPVVPTDWAVNAQTLARQCADRLVFESRIRFSGRTGSGTAAMAVLPENALNARVGGADLQPVRIQADADGVKWLFLRWETPDVLEREVIAHYELALPEPGQPWPIMAPVVEGARSAQNLFVVVPEAGIQLSGGGGESGAASPQLPEWMRHVASQAEFFLARADGPITVDARQLPRLEADTARIPEARFETRLVSDGAMLCQARIRLQHRGTTRWRFQLPEGSELLTCEVAGEPMNPLVREPDGLELPIPSRSGERSEISEIALSYTARKPAFEPVEGRVDVALLSTPLLIEDLGWTLALPEGYETTAFEGNVEVDRSGSDGAIRFRKRLSRNEAPSVEIYYRKRERNL